MTEKLLMALLTGVGFGAGMSIWLLLQRLVAWLYLILRSGK